MCLLLLYQPSIQIFKSCEHVIFQMKGENRKKSATSLFTDTGLMFVEKETTPPQADLTQLIEICGGKVSFYSFYNRFLPS